MFAQFDEGGDNLSEAVKKIVIAACAVAVCAAAIVIIGTLPDGEHSATGFMMDTAVTARVTGKNAQQTAEGALEAVSDLERLISRTVDSSDVGRLNSKRTAELSPPTLEILEQSLEVCRRSGGAFDITLGSLSGLWDVNADNPVLPASAEVARLANAAGYEKIAINEGVVSLPQTVLLDFGAVGKGAACDKIKAYLQTTQTSRAVISVGGSILLYGKGDFTVGISSPERGGADYIATVKMSEGFVSTSGTYERYFDLDGVRYHHILSPETGYPIQNGLVSVTVIADNGLISDALSTACFVLGLEDGMRLAEEYGCEAVLVTADKSVYVTDALRGKTEIVDGSYSFAKA